MAVVPPPRASTRGKAAARPPTQERPSNWCGLLYEVVDSDRRTRNFMLLGVLAIIGVCVLVYTWVVATKGVHAFDLRLLLPGGVFGVVGGGTLTFAVTALKKRFVRRRAAAVVDPQTTGPSPDPSHTPGRLEGTPGQPQ
jgi:hypothetical protein